ncbi:hypothetical protein HJ583_007435 [Uliginosibacterium sp. IMCC34675]|uniref:Uncharacterized protein n=2 Tax=Zoogloeaceae TaxID=2008794 RepID=A0ABX2IG75_9RHOO|nr:hypothetical protein [Uliginosibacterium aquaticum]PLK47791.1 hypothetical protein C0V76_15600 [Uliginosibacterium sp. TH139]
MAITAEQLTQVARLTLAAESLGAAVSAVRTTLPGLRVSSVDAMDMKHEEPALNIGERALFLMESDGHCWSVTRDPALAAGIVLTQKM